MCAAGGGGAISVAQAAPAGLASSISSSIPERSRVHRPVTRPRGRVRLIPARVGESASARRTLPGTPMHGRLSPAAVRLSLIRVSSVLSEFPISPRMGRARRLAGSRRVRIGVNAVFITGALAAAVLTMLHFLDSGWPLASADPLLVVAAGILFLFAYAFQAWGWQRLFREQA